MLRHHSRSRMSRLPSRLLAGAAVGTSGTAAQQPETTTAQAELPRTASPLPLSGLIALLSLAGAAGLRAFRS